MNLETMPLWLALFLQLGMGFAVYRANPRNYANQAFLLVSLILAAWLISLHLAFIATSSEAAAFWVRNASASGPLIVIAFNLLRLAIVHRDDRWRVIGKATMPIAILCLIAAAG